MDFFLRKFLLKRRSYFQETNLISLKQMFFEPLSFPLIVLGSVSLGLKESLTSR
jgi:hypothetical protein